MIENNYKKKTLEIRAGQNRDKMMFKAQSIELGWYRK